MQPLPDASVDRPPHTAQERSGTVGTSLQDMGAEAHPPRGGAVVACGGMCGQGTTGHGESGAAPGARSSTGSFGEVFDSSWGGRLKAKIEPVDMVVHQAGPAPPGEV